MRATNSPKRPTQRYQSWSNFQCYRAFAITVQIKNADITLETEELLRIGKVILGEKTVPRLNTGGGRLRVEEPYRCQTLNYRAKPAIF